MLHVPIGQAKMKRIIPMFLALESKPFCLMRLPLVVKNNY
jgi:hypothetical protein